MVRRGRQRLEHREKEKFLLEDCFLLFEVVFVKFLEFALEILPLEGEGVITIWGLESFSYSTNNSKR